MKAVAQLGGAGEYNIIEVVVAQQAAERRKHQAGVAGLAAGEVAHLDDAIPPGGGAEPGFDGGLDGLLQILLQIEALAAGQLETAGADQQAVGPVEPSRQGRKWGMRALNSWL